LLVPAIWFARKLAAAAFFLTHNAKLISGWPLPHTYAEQRGWRASCRDQTIRDGGTKRSGKASRWSGSQAALKWSGVETA